MKQVQGGAPENTQDQWNKALFGHAVLQHVMWKRMVQPKEKDLNAKHSCPAEPTFLEHGWVKLCICSCYIQLLDVFANHNIV